MCAATLFAGYLLKAQCLEPWQDGWQYERLCYNDIQPLYGIRLFRTTPEGGQERVVPYIHARLVDHELQDGAIEYPVLTGVFMWATGALVDGSSPDAANDYFRFSALLLAPFGLLTAYWLTQFAGWRALMWAGAPAIALYAFHNWDLLVVAAAVGGFWLWARGSPIWAAVLFGVGACFKLYPIFFLAPLALESWRARERRSALAVVGAGVGTFAAINLPFAVINFDGWWATYEFHDLRLADFNSIWHWLAGWPPWQDHLFALNDVENINRLTMVLIAGSFLIALLVGWQASRDGRYPFVQVSAAMLAAFLLWNKVHSPQYALWILPFFVLLRVSVVWWAAYAVVDAIFYVGIFRWFYDSFALGMDYTTAKRALLFAIWARAALLGALIVVFLRAEVARRRPADARRARTVSYPVSRVGAVGEQEPA